MEQFLHDYKLTITAPPQLDKTPKNISPETADTKVVKRSEDFRTIDLLEAKVFTDLPLTCTIGSIKGNGSGQSSVIKIRGLSDDSLGFIRKNGVVILEAGYKSSTQLPVILAGQIINKDVSDDKDIPEVKLTVSDGYIPNSSVKISREYYNDVTYLEILNDLASIYSDNGIPLGRAIEPLQGVGVDLPIDQLKHPYGTCLVGYLDTCLGQVCKECGYTFYLSNSRLYIEPENYNKTTLNFSFTERNILSLKESTSKNNNNAKDNQEQNTGYLMKTYLDGRIEVGMFIDITIDGESRGAFKVVSVVHELDYEGSNWFTKTGLQNV